MRDDAQRLACLPRLLPDGMEDAGVGAIVDDVMRTRRIEPARGVIVAQPLGDEDREVRMRIGLGEQRVHEGGALALVAFVDAMDDAHPRMALPCGR